MLSSLLTLLILGQPRRVETEDGSELQSMRGIIYAEILGYCKQKVQSMISFDSATILSSREGTDSQKKLGKLNRINGNTYVEPTYTYPHVPFACVYFGNSTEPSQCSCGLGLHVSKHRLALSSTTQ